MSELRGARVLVTGGAGFLGRRVVARLEGAAATPFVVRSTEVDLRERGATFDLLASLRPDHVVHCAAAGGGIGWMRLHPATAYSTNVLMNTNVLDAAQAAGVRRLVGVSSACAYAVDAPQPMREADVFLGEPEPTNGPYGLAKRAMLVHGRALHEEHGFDCAFVVPTNLYGPEDDFGPRSHVVAALIRRFEEARREGAPEVVAWGTGRATRDLLYVDDAADAIVLTLERGGGPAPINLGSGVERPIATIARAVATAVGYEGAIAWDAARPDGMPRKVLDVRVAESRLGWRARTSLDAGLAEAVTWYRRSF